MHAGCSGVGAHGHVDRQDRIHDEVAEADGLNACAMTLAVRVPGHDADAGARLGHDDVGDGAVAHDAVAYAHTDGVAGAAEHAIGDDHMFARLVFAQHFGVAAQGDAIVARSDDAIADRHMAAAVDVKAVAIGRGRRVGDGQPANVRMVAPNQQECPIRRVDEGHIAYGDIPALAEKDHLTGRQPGMA